MSERKSTKQRRKRRRFTDEFKAATVQRVLAGTKTAGQVARELDLTETAVRSWVKQARVDGGKGPASALTTAEKEELARLRKENRELKMDREILKKAAASGGLLEELKKPPLSDEVGTLKQLMFRRGRFLYLVSPPRRVHNSAPLREPYAPRAG